MSTDALAVRAQVQCEIQTLECKDTTRHTRSALTRALVTCVSPCTISRFKQDCRLFPSYCEEYKEFDLNFEMYF